jgi:hypothetical protein
MRRDSLYQARNNRLKGDIEMTAESVVLAIHGLISKIREDVFDRLDRS